MRRQTRRSWAPALPRGARPRRRCHCRPTPPRWSRRLSRRHRSTQPSCACAPPGCRCRTAPSTRGISEDLITAVITRMRRELTIENARTPVPQHARNCPCCVQGDGGHFRAIMWAAARRVVAGMWWERAWQTWRLGRGGGTASALPLFTCFWKYFCAWLRICGAASTGLIGWAGRKGMLMLLRVARRNTLQKMMTA